MNIRTRMCVSVDGCVATPDGLPVQLADPAFVPGESYEFPEFQESCEAVLMGRTTFEPALSADRWPWPNLDVFVLGSHRPSGASWSRATPIAWLTGSERRTAAVTPTSSAGRARSRRFGRSERSTSWV